METLTKPKENELEVIRNVNRELVRKKKEIEAMTDEAKKQKVLRAYAKFLTNLPKSLLKIEKVKH